MVYMLMVQQSTMILLTVLLFAVSLPAPLFATNSDCDGAGFCSTDNQVEYNIEHRTRPHPQVKNLNYRVTAMSAKFRSLSGRNLDVWYDNGTPEGTEQAKLTPGMMATTNTYEGHSFFVTVQGNKSHVLSRFSITKERVLYPIYDPEVPADEDTLEHNRREEEYAEEYLHRTGRAWRHYYGIDGPRPPPTLFMWPADSIGDVHRVTSNQSYWKCMDSQENCQTFNESIALELEVVSTEPRAFIISNFLSEFEAEQIIETAKPKLHHSTVGNKLGGGTRSSSTRTSSNAWISRNSGPFYDSLYRRAADLLRLDEAILHPTQNVEDIQVVHYINGQKYDSHHDWGVAGYPESRYITLLMYLTDMPSATAGGETSFPKGADGQGFKVMPKKGDAVLFYNLLEDGNGDDLALHAALPAVEGEKWLANFWVW